MEVNTIRFKNPPHVNTIDWEDFQKRTEVIFETLGGILGKTLGAYGAPTLISAYPHSFVTKDGYRIASNIIFNKEEGEPVDRVINGMAMNICSRLNFAVGDGTTTAIIATNEIYKSSCEFGLNNLGRRPKDILEVFNKVKNDIVKEIEASAKFIKEDEIGDVIRKIVNVSTNGNKEITDLIVQAYEELQGPGIVLDNSDTPDTYMQITDGYKSSVRITERIYVNNGKGTCDVSKLDVLIFGHRVEKEAYEKIILPADTYAHAHGRRILCLAPYYDEDLLSKSISQRVRGEYEQSGYPTLIIGAYLNRLGADKKSIEDLAMLLNTTIIDKDYENRIIERVSDGAQIFDVINIDRRGISGISVLSKDGNKRAGTVDDLPEETDDFVIRMGFADSANLGAKSSVFVCTQYNKGIYEQFLKDAQLDLQEAINSNATFGNYNRTIIEAQERYMGLQMKLATIYLGGDSELSRGMLKDSVTDAIRAAESAYRYGYIYGCNLTTILAIKHLLETTEKNADNKAYRNTLHILLAGFRSVYRKILNNAFQDESISLKWLSDIGQCKEWPITLSDEMRKKLSCYSKQNLQGLCSLYYCVEESSEILEMPFDLERLEFSSDIINSVRTDVEVLTAVIDLLGILISGNQVIMYNYSEV